MNKYGKYKTANKLQFTEEVDMFLFREAYENHRNSPYYIVDRVRVNVSSDDKRLKCYQAPQEEVDRIESMLKGGNDSGPMMNQLEKKLLRKMKSMMTPVTNSVHCCDCVTVDTSLFYVTYRLAVGITFHLTHM